MFKTIKIIKELSIVLLPLEQIKQIEIFTAGIMSEDEMMLSFHNRSTMMIFGNLMIEKIWRKKQWREGGYASTHPGLNFLPAQKDSFRMTDSTFEYVLNLF